MDIAYGPKLCFTFMETTDLTIKLCTVSVVRSDFLNMDHALMKCRRISPIEHMCPHLSDVLERKNVRYIIRTLECAKLYVSKAVLAITKAGPDRYPCGGSLNVVQREGVGKD